MTTPNELQRLREEVERLKADALKTVDRMKAYADTVNAQLKSSLAQAQACVQNMRGICEQALHHLGDVGSGSEHDPSWIRPKTLPVKELQERAMQAYHILHAAIDDSKPCGTALLEELRELREFKDRVSLEHADCFTNQQFADNVGELLRSFKAKHEK